MRFIRVLQTQHIDPHYFHEKLNCSQQIFFSLEALLTSSCLVLTHYV